MLSTCSSSVSVLKNIAKVSFLEKTNKGNGKNL